MLDDYVYKYLEKYGNTILSVNDLKRYGKTNIIKELSKHGYNCSISVIGENKAIDNKYLGCYNDATVIIKVIDK